MSLKPTVSFSSHYTAEQFSAYQAASAAMHAADEGKALVPAWAKQHEILEAAVVSYLQDLASIGQLAPAQFAERRQLPWADAWNRLVSGAEPHHWDLTRISEPFDMMLSLAMQKSTSVDDLAARLEQLPISGKIGECDVTGDAIFLRMKGWKPVLCGYKNREFTPLAEEAQQPSVRHVEIKVPSGELLIADWLRVDGFSAVVDANKRERKSFNTNAGRQATAIEYAEQFGFLSVSVGNSSPHIFQQDGQIMIAEPEIEPGPNDPAPAGEDRGYVCTDFWGATVIDREVLTEIVAQTHGRTEAEAKVAALLADKSNHIVTVYVDAGKPLHAYFESERGFQGRFECPDVNMAGLDRAYATLSSKALEWSAVPEKRTSPRP